VEAGQINTREQEEKLARTLAEDAIRKSFEATFRLSTDRKT
jgi:hypothetical protein